MHRRTFLALPAAALAADLPLDLAAIERKRVLDAADRYLKESPVTVTASRSVRSAGGLHDYFSEGDYWWPDPANPEGPYMQRDGLSNPANFTAHRAALMRLSLQVPALCAAWKLTGKRVYAEHALRHVDAWFAGEGTRMNPSLLYAQAIHGRATGRGTGIIDTIHLVEVVRGLAVIEPAARSLEPIRSWFREYLNWISTHPYGIQERDAANNHATCWVMQAAEFARFTADSKVSDFCRQRFKTALLPQMAPDGSFPQELRRTKPYGYSIFNLEVMAVTCEILGLWEYAMPDDRSLAKAMEWLYPFLADKSRWTRPPDVMYFDQWPVRQVSLLFAGRALHRPEYLALWKRLNPDPNVEETIRNYPVRQPILWS